MNDDQTVNNLLPYVCKDLILATNAAEPEMRLNLQDDVKVTTGAAHCFITIAEST